MQIISHRRLFPASYHSTISDTSTEVNKLSGSVATMIILTLVVANFMFCSGSGVPFFLLPEYFDNEKGEEFGVAASVNKSANPCNNFYDYACGGWISKTTPPDFQLVWNHWQSITQRILKRMQVILESELVSPYLEKTKQMYRACVQTKNSGPKHLSNLKALVNSLNGWPLVTPSWNANEYDWASSVAEIIRSVGVYPLLKMHVFIDLQNTSQYALYIEHGEIALPQTILINPQNHKHHMQGYELWVLQTVRYLFPNRIHPDLKSEIREMIEFEAEIARLLQTKDRSEKMYISELSEQFPLKWQQVFDKLFYGTSIRVNSSDTVILRNRQYLQKLISLISNTKIRTVANYLIWSVVRNLSGETTKYLRRLNSAMDFTIFGNKKDIALTQECVSKVNMYMYSTLTPTYVQLYLHPHATKEVNRMIKNIKSEFIQMLKRNTWLESATKNLAVEKIASIKYAVAYPEWFNNETLVENLYTEVKISNNHFMNMLQLKQFKIKDDLEKLKQSVKLEWPGSIFEVNAYYSILQNSIFIPLGMLEFPFFDVTAPMVYNYGALGSLIGHEISHALDVLGRHADKNGNIINWWPPSDAYKYEIATECFKQQYNNYNINGINTLGEDIADNVGLKISYSALENVEWKQLQTGASDLKEFSTNQLFFIAFAQVWCEIAPENELLNEEEHAPVQARVSGTLQNSKEFDKAFYCFKNDKDKCMLW